MKYKNLALLFLGIGTLAIWQISQSGKLRRPDANVKNASQPGHVVVAFGDGLAGSDGFGGLLASTFKFDVQLAGKDGETSLSALARIDEVIALKPNFVIVSLGADDLRQRLALDETLSSLDTIFTRLIDAGALVAYVPIEVPGIGDNWNMAISDLGATRGVLVMHGATAGLWNNPDGLDQKLHLESPERQALAAAIHAQLQPYL